MEDQESLSALLDDALGDFGKTKTSDQELDDFMDAMDREAAQKAAGKFQQMLQKLVEERKEEEEEKQEVTANPSSSKDEFTETLNRCGNLWV